ncbi:TPA: hypothetical protein ACT5B2_000104 [Burkholderia cenocepacia]
MSIAIEILENAHLKLAAAQQEFIKALAAAREVASELTAEASHAVSAIARDANRIAYYLSMAESRPGAHAMWEAAADQGVAVPPSIMTDPWHSQNVPIDTPAPAETAPVAQTPAITVVDTPAVIEAPVVTVVAETQSEAPADPVSTDTTAPATSA